MIKVFKNPKSLLPALAEFIAAQAQQAIDRDGRFNFVLSGGSSPKKLYELLASKSYRGKINWQKVYFFFGDERYVPHDHADSNFLMVKTSLFDPLQISMDHVFAIDTKLLPAESARGYEEAIRGHFKGPCRFDLILLGLGDNSHTASLFPHTSVLNEKSALVKETFVEEVKMYRITLTAPLINRAHSIVFLVFGAGKAEAVHHIMEEELNIAEYPAQLIKPEKGELHWFLDEAAAAQIKKN